MDWTPEGGERLKGGVSVDWHFDHLLHAVLDPEATRFEFARLLGWRTMAGGEHRAFGTYNALAYFGLSYIEWIAVRDAGLAAASELGSRVQTARTQGAGPFWCALRTTQMDRVIAAWHQDGLPFQGPVEASRELPDGRVIRWQMLFAEQEGRPDTCLIPFVIQWVADDATRLADLVGRGALPPSGRCDLQLTAVHFASSRMEAVTRRMEQYFRIQGEPCVDERFGTGRAFTIGSTRLLYWHRLKDAPGEPRSEGPFQLDLAERSREDRACFTVQGLRVELQPACPTSSEV